MYEQAVKCTGRFKVKKGSSTVSRYEAAERELRENFPVKEFTSYSDEWLDYIIACRRGKCPKQYDVVIGGVANDKVFDTIELFSDGLIEKSTAIERLRYEKLQKKYAKVIESFAKECHISVEESLDFFYESEVYLEVSEGISDMHCRSDKYLVQELKMEYMEKIHKPNC